MNKATSLRGTLLVVFALSCAALLPAACNRAKKATEAKAKVPTTAAVPEALDPNKLPGFVDRDLFRALTNVVYRCKVDTARSSVACPDDYFNNIATLYRKGHIPRHEAMQTVSYVFEHGTIELETAAAELLFLAFRSPNGTTPELPVARRLLDQLRDLPWAQGVDAAPAITLMALRLNLDGEVFAALDAAKDKRVTAAGYRYAMAEARLRVFDRIFQAAGSDNLELAVAAVESAREMGGRTVEENEKICGFMRELLTSGRAVIETRAAGVLATCGAKHLEVVLASDEKRLAAGQPLSGGIGIYTNACRAGEKHPFGAPSAAQCNRLKKLATGILDDRRSREADRVAALAILTEQFPGKDTLALATKYADDPEASVLARRAKDALKGSHTERRERLE